MKLHSQYIFCWWVPSFNMMFVKFIHIVVSSFSVLSYLYNECIYLFDWVLSGMIHGGFYIAFYKVFSCRKYILQFIYCAVDGHWVFSSSGQLCIVMLMNILVLVSWCTCASIQLCVCPRMALSGHRTQTSSALVEISKLCATVIVSIYIFTGRVW